MPRRLAVSSRDSIPFRAINVANTVNAPPIARTRAGSAVMRRGSGSLPCVALCSISGTPCTVRKWDNHKGEGRPTGLVAPHPPRQRPLVVSLAETGQACRFVRASVVKQHPALSRHPFGFSNPPDEGEIDNATPPLRCMALG